MNAKKELDKQIDALFKLMNLLIPNCTPNDIDYLEDNIEEIERAYKDASNLKIFGCLEDFLFEYGEEKFKRLLERVLLNFEDNKCSWDDYYNRKSFLKAEHSKLLYKSAELKTLIKRTDFLIRNTLQEIKNFNNHYFKSEIKSRLFDRINDSDTLIRATILLKNYDQGRDEMTGNLVEEKISKFIIDFLSIELEFTGGRGDFFSNKVLSKYDYKDERFPKYEERIYLTFDKFEENEKKYFEKLKIQKEEIISEFKNEIMYLRIIEVNKLDVLLNNLRQVLEEFMTDHLAFLNDEINAAEFWIKLEFLFHFPENEKVIIYSDHLKYFAVALINRVEILRELLEILEGIYLSIDSEGESNKQGDRPPIFSMGEIDTILGILEVYFKPKDRVALRDLLEKGFSEKSPILFLSNGNKLLDAFKKLYEYHYITGIEKQELQNWIRDNFIYSFRGQEKAYTQDYLEKNISRNGYPCKDTILLVESGKIVKSSNQFTKKIKKY